MRYTYVLAFLFLFGYLSASPSFAKLSINEFSSGSGNDWIELYNDSDETIALTGFSIRDNTDSNKKDLEGEIGAREFFIFDWTRLNADQDTLRLFNGETLEDEISYGTEYLSAPTADQSAGRIEEGSNDWKIFAAHSKGSSNAESEVSVPPTAVPTNTPTPTKVPTPTKTLTPTKTPKPTPTEVRKETSHAPTQRISPSIQKDIPVASQSTVLAASTSATVSKQKGFSLPIPSKTQSSTVLSASKMPRSGIAIGGAGILLLSACGILVMKKYTGISITTLWKK